MLRPGGDKVDTSGFNAGVAQHIRQLHHVPAVPVEGPGEEMPEIVGGELLNYKEKTLLQKNDRIAFAKELYRFV